MNFIADLHIHSRFSRATSKALNARHLAAWARCKGINVLGTGDFTHPQWRAELAEHLVLDEATGLYRLAVEPETFDFMDAPTGSALPQSPPPLFILQTEISSIYKRGGKVRKVHNLVFVPTLEDAERLSRRLAQIGNLNADGRPILGLDSRDLLEIMLECAPGSVMIPAHVWTPWFALFGSKSGFDRLEDCYGDLSEHIFALETGLSSDPAMNRLISGLDGYALVSNSDAHSGANLGREANLFAGRPSYAGMFAALRASAKRQDQSALNCRFLGTMEFYPDEGKYHLDGHRACNVVLEPKDSLALGNICPVCGKPLTVGVLHRVLELADRETTPQLPREPEVRPLIPLAEVVGEILEVGPTSRRVQERYSRLLRELGPELDILCSLPEADIRAHWEPLGEAVARMRRGQVYREGGYDGEYGTVRVFAPEELADMRGALPGVKAPAKRGRKKAAAAAGESAAPDATTATTATTGVRVRRAGQLLTGSTDAAAASNFAAVKSAAQPDNPEQIFAYSAEQQAALSAGPEPVLVLAGPGAGKTRVLVARLQWLAGQGQDMSRVLAVTFTRRAANELRERLSGAFSAASGTLPQCDTLHGMAWAALRAASGDNAPLLLGDDAALNLFRLSNPGLEPREARNLWDRLALARESATLAQEPAQSPLALAAANYTARKNAGQRYVDYADLLDWWLAHASTLPENIRPQHVLVDEVQDLSAVQLAIVRALLPADGKGFFGIGDPDQAIYGFRGVTGQSETSLQACWPELTVYRLGQSYRSSQSVLDMARSLLLHKGQCGPLKAAQQLTADLRLFTAPDEHAEARWIAARVQHLLGATAHTLMDRQNPDDLHGLAGTLAPGDIAVLVRLKAQIAPLLAALEKAGIPCAAPSQDAFWQDPTCARLLALLGGSCGFALFFADAPDREAAGEGAPEEADALPREWCTAGSLPAPEAMSGWLAARPWAGELFTGGHSWRQLCHTWKQCGGWTAFFEQLAWLREAELVREKAERVQILTLHASKGLEFQAVFIPGLEDGLLPMHRSTLFAGKDTDPAEPDNQYEELRQDEERRLLYVGLTRAARALFLSHCEQRSLYGRTLRLPPSPFMTQIREFCRHSSLAAHTRKEHKQVSLF